MTDKEALLILNALPNFGPRTIQAIVDSGSKPSLVFSAMDAFLEKAVFLKSPAKKTLINWQQHFDIKKEIKLLQINNISVITVLDAEYPSILHHIYDPPPVLYCKGTFLEQDNRSIAIVGSRRSSLYGQNSSRKIAYQLGSRGITVVSGMARGIDSQAHRGSLDAKARTIAVLGSGLLKVYPTENKKLFEEIADNGAVVSEFPLTCPPIPQNFPRRNRIISGLSLGVLVIEAAKRSGSLITARFAAEQNRQVFALPGRIDSPLSQGVNDLLKDGACLVSNVDDIIAELPDLDVQPAIQPSEENRSLSSLSPVEKAIYILLENECRLFDEIISQSGRTVPETHQALLQLEMKGLIKQLPGKKYVKK